MTDREIMQMALEALENLQGLCTDAEDGCLEAITIWTPEAIAALRERLAQFDGGEQSVELTQTGPKLEQQEPVAHLWQHSETGRTRIVMPDQIVTADANWIIVGPLYLAPPRRDWVGLTQREIDDLYVEHHDAHGYTLSATGYERAIEAKLKEKNS